MYNTEIIWENSGDNCLGCGRSGDYLKYVEIAGDLAPLDSGVITARAPNYQPNAKREVGD